MWVPTRFSLLPPPPHSYPPSNGLSPVDGINKLLHPCVSRLSEDCLNINSWFASIVQVSYTYIFRIVLPFSLFFCIVFFFHICFGRVETQAWNRLTWRSPPTFKHRQAQGNSPTVHVPAATSGETLTPQISECCALLFGKCFTPFRDTSPSPKKKKSTLCAHLRGKATLCARVAMMRSQRRRGTGGGRGSLLLPTEVCQTGTLREQRSGRYRCLLTDTQAFIQVFVLMYAAQAGGEGERGSEAGDGWDGLLGRAISKIGCISITRHKIDNFI